MNDKAAILTLILLNLNLYLNLEENKIKIGEEISIWT